MNREDVTDLIIEAKVKKGIKWADVATKVGLSKEWVTAACLGQMTLTAEQAATIILDGVQASRWRILVGDDAHRLDAMVRNDPEAAYTPEFAEAWRDGRKPLV